MKRYDFSLDMDSVKQIQIEDHIDSWERLKNGIHNIDKSKKQVVVQEKVDQFNTRTLLVMSDFAKMQSAVLEIEQEEQHAIVRVIADNIILLNGKNNNFYKEIENSTVFIKQFENKIVVEIWFQFWVWEERE